MAEVSYKVVIHQSWWVAPFLKVMAFNVSIGIGVDLDKIAGFIARHGVRATLVPMKP